MQTVGTKSNTLSTFANITISTTQKMFVRILPQALHALHLDFSSFRQLSRLKTLNNELNQQVNSLINAWETRRPVWLLFLLYQLSEEQLKQSNLPMLDAYLAQKSHLLRKQLHSIETPEEQCDPLIGLDQEQVSTFE